MVKLKARGILYVFIAMFVLGVALVPICYGQGETQGVSNLQEGLKHSHQEKPNNQPRRTPDRPTVNINTSFYSQYIWRGYELSHETALLCSLR